MKNDTSKYIFENLDPKFSQYRALHYSIESILSFEWAEEELVYTKRIPGINSWNSHLINMGGRSLAHVCVDYNGEEYRCLIWHIKDYYLDAKHWPNWHHRRILFGRVPTFKPPGDYRPPNAVPISRLLSFFPSEKAEEIMIADGGTATGSKKIFSAIWRSHDKY